MSLPSKIFVTGTDTGVGKTVVTAALAHCLSEAGKRVSVVKPVQTGTSCQKVSDIQFVYKLLGRDINYTDHCPYSFSQPLSPKTGAELENSCIDIEIIKSAINKQARLNDIVIIEGAGGLMVPITERFSMADLAKDTGCKLIVTARPGLGTINHTALSIEYAKSRGLQILGIVINNFPKEPGLSEKTNPQELIRITGVPVVGVLKNDTAIDVENGHLGMLKNNSVNSFISQFGGNLEIDEFLSSIKLQYL